LGEAWGVCRTPRGRVHGRAFRQFSASCERVRGATIWFMLPPLQNLQNTVLVAGAALMALLMTLPS
jgi:hypothetical protein